MSASKPRMKIIKGCQECQFACLDYFNLKPSLPVFCFLNDQFIDCDGDKNMERRCRLPKTKDGSARKIKVTRCDRCDHFTRRKKDSSFFKDLHCELTQERITDKQTYPWISKSCPLPDWRDDV